MPTMAISCSGSWLSSGISVNLKSVKGNDSWGTATF